MNDRHASEPRAPPHHRLPRPRPHRFTTSDLTNPILTDFISDQQALVERTTRRTYREGDDDFEVARSVVTDLDAMMALVRLTGGTTSGLDHMLGRLDVTKQGQLESRLRVIFELKVRAREGLSVLQRDSRKHSFVLINGAD